MILDKILKRLAVFSIQIYRYTFGSLLGPACRFHPSCSHYAQQAFIDFGFWRGLWLTVKRLLRCHPWCEGGYDPVPTKN